MAYQTEEMDEKRERGRRKRGERGGVKGEGESKVAAEGGEEASCDENVKTLTKCEGEEVSGRDEAAPSENEV